MPRGKNYVNQHNGMALQAGRNNTVKELCFFGNACQRKDCIYRHDTNTTTITGNLPKSQEPCIAYVAGICTFTSKTCRKRHPTSDDEIQSIIQKYQSIPCRFGMKCKTKGCLYNHPDPDTIDQQEYQYQYPYQFDTIPPTPTIIPAVGSNPGYYFVPGVVNNKIQPPSPTSHVPSSSNGTMNTTMINSTMTNNSNTYVNNSTNVPGLMQQQQPNTMISSNPTSSSILENNRNNGKHSTNKILVLDPVAFPPLSQTQNSTQHTNRPK